MTETLIPFFTSIVPDTAILQGNKIKINQVLDIPVIVTGWKIDKSKFMESGKNLLRLILQLDINDLKRVLISSSSVLISQLRLFLKRSLMRKFKTIIRHINKFYKFS